MPSRGPKHQIVVVNVQAPRGWTPRVNAKLTVFAQQYRNVELAELARRDRSPTSQRSPTDRSILDPPEPGSTPAPFRAALQRLAESQVFAPNGYRLAPIPR